MNCRRSGATRGACAALTAKVEAAIPLRAAASASLLRSLSQKYYHRGKIAICDASVPNHPHESKVRSGLLIDRTACRYSFSEHVHVERHGSRFQLCNNSQKCRLLAVHKSSPEAAQEEEVKKKLSGSQTKEH